MLAVRDGTWKWIEGPFPEGVPTPMLNASAREAQPALYDLDADPAETRNIIAEHSEVAEAMQSTLDRYRRKEAMR